MPNLSNIPDLIKNAADYISRKQRTDGSFESLSSIDPTDFRAGVPRHTTFFTSAILARLANCELPTVRQIRNRASGFLLNEKSNRWSFNYWSKKSAERTLLPYPDDFDDTFAALAALIRHNPSLGSGEMLAASVKILTAAESEPGGPYRTWLVGRDAAAVWHDVDLAVNGTIAYFLSLVEVQLPNLENFFTSAIQNQKFISPYYPGPIHVAYIIARSYRGAATEPLAIWLKEQLENCGNAQSLNPLEIAMAVTSLIDLGFAEKIPVNVIPNFITELSQQGWQPYAFCIDPSRDGKRCYAGSSALTAAYCIEALIKIGGGAQPNGQPEEKKREERATTMTTHERIIQSARSECEKLGSEQFELQQTALAYINTINDEEITGLAYAFHLSLGKAGGTIDESILDRLALGNLYGWMAYTIYDDFLDNEGDPKLLSTANFFSRQLARIYKELDAKAIPGTWNLLNEMTNRIDGANAWEQNNLPSLANLTNLANRSIGHAMGPLAELLALGYPPESPEYIATLALFHHYLIARQLHDDAHDWADDLKRGRINIAAALIFEKDPTARAESLPRLRIIFWRSVIDELVVLIRYHVAAARTARAMFEPIARSAFLETQLAVLESSAIQTIQERDEMVKFLAA